MSEAFDCSWLEPWGSTPTWVGPRVDGGSSWVWPVDDDAGAWVVKCVRDAPAFVEPGLRVAEAMDATGLAVGRPRRTLGGELCSPCRQVTVAMLERVGGEDLHRSAPDAPSIAGAVLGRVHARSVEALDRSSVPGALLAWAEAHAPADVVGAAAAATRDLVHGVVYGDPWPEIRVLPSGVGLIDWGTPSWAPLVWDVAVWLRWLRAGPGSSAEADFIKAYRVHRTLSGRELSAVPPVVALADVVAPVPD